LGDRIRYILEGGSSKIGLESTIIDVRNEKRPNLLRPGEVTAEEIETILGVSVKSTNSCATDGSQIAPGMLSQHYSPRAKVVLHDQLPTGPLSKSAEAARLYFAKPSGKSSVHTYWLDTTGDQKRAAHNLFAQLRLLDEKDYLVVHAEKAPHGLYANAINDRLSRAAAKQ
jgi:L-threonylcarbamoyladenylate synthase